MAKKVQFTPDLLTIVMVTAFLVNLGIYLSCQNTNLELMSQRDNRHNRPPQSTEDREEHNSRATEHEHMERGEAEQELRAPNTPPKNKYYKQKGIHDKNDRRNDKDLLKHPSDKNKAENQDKEIDNKNELDHHWLSTALHSSVGRKALESLSNRNDSLKLSQDQKSKLFEEDSKKEQNNVGMAINDVFTILRPAQIKYILSQREHIKSLSEEIPTTTVAIENTCERLLQIKNGNIIDSTSFRGDRGIWDPKSTALAVSMLVDISQEECMLNQEQAQKLSKALNKLKEADVEMQAKQEESKQIEKILSEEQMLYLYKKLKDNMK